MSGMVALWKPTERKLMSMEFKEFEDAYYALLTRAWTSEDYTMEMMANPVPALREVGFKVPGGVELTILRAVAGEGDLSDQYRMWNEGIESGAVTVVVPEVPPVDLGDLGELTEAELAEMPGGTSYCCSCTPCCTCTA